MVTQQTLQTEEYKETELGQLPKDWSVVRLGDYCKVFSGFAFKSTDFVKEGVFVVKIGNIQNGNVAIDNRTNYFPKEKIIGNVKKFILKKDDILIAMTGATTGKVGVVPKEHENSLLNQRVGKFDIFSKELDNNFFRYFSITKEFQEKVLDNILKSAQGNVSPKQIENINISFPPLPEQQKIAYVLSTIQNAREKTDNFINSLKELKKSSMKHLFIYGAVSFEDTDKVELKETEIGMMPNSWEVGKFDDIVTQQEKIEINSDSFVSFEHIQSGTGKLLSQDSAKKFRTKTPFQKGTVLYGRIRPYLNKVWLAEFNGYCTNDIIRLKSKNSDVNFVKYILLSDSFVHYATSKSQGTKMPRVKWEAMKVYPLALPPIAEQQNIAAILSTIDSKIQAEENKKKALEEIFNSMLKDLMTAKLIVNNFEVSE